jgi:transposase
MYTKITIKWAEIDGDIGQMSDRAVARKHGVSHAAVSNRRNKLRIPAMRKRKAQGRPRKADRREDEK